MKFIERNEIIKFRESSPEIIRKIKWLESIFEKMFLAIFELVFSKVTTGSERWHIIQDRLSMKPSVGINSKKRALFYYKTLLKCGESLYVHPHVAIYFPQNVELGDNVYFNRGVFITARENVKIGSNVLIGPYTVINSGNHSYKDPSKLIRSQGHKAFPIIIENDVWVGAQSTILPGVTIGEGAIVAAGAVVTKNVEPYTLVAGVPARVVKRRS